MSFLQSFTYNVCRFCSSPMLSGSVVRISQRLTTNVCKFFNLPMLSGSVVRLHSLKINVCKFCNAQCFQATLSANAFECAMFLVDYTFQPTPKFLHQACSAMLWGLFHANSKYHQQYGSLSSSLSIFRLPERLFALPLYRLTLP